MLSLRTRLPQPVYPVSPQFPLLVGLPTQESPRINRGVGCRAVQDGRLPFVR